MFTLSKSVSINQSINIIKVDVTFAARCQHVSFHKLTTQCLYVVLQTAYYNYFKQSKLTRPIILPSVLWCCWLGGGRACGMYRRGICLQRGANDLYMVHLLPRHLLIQ